MKFIETPASVFKNIFLLMVLVSSATLVFAEDHKEKRVMSQDKQYQSDIQYAGEYIPTALYYRHVKSQPWMHVNKSDNYFDQVAPCAVAKAKLSSEGRWVGNLNSDGSCGTHEEPAVYMLGNRLNYDDAMKNN